MGEGEAMVLGLLLCAAMLGLFRAVGARVEMA